MPSALVIQHPVLMVGFQPARTPREKQLIPHAASRARQPLPPAAATQPPIPDTAEPALAKLRLHNPSATCVQHECPFAPRPAGGGMQTERCRGESSGDGTSHGSVRCWIFVNPQPPPAPPRPPLLSHACKMDGRQTPQLSLRNLSREHIYSF